MLTTPSLINNIIYRVQKCPCLDPGSIYIPSRKIGFIITVEIAVIRLIGRVSISTGVASGGGENIEIKF